MNKTIGNAGKPRIFAFIIDNLVATIAALVMVAFLNTTNQIINITVLCLTYLGYYLIFESLWS